MDKVMTPELEAAIRNEFETCVRKTIQRLATEDTHRPFHRALLSEEALRWSRFERSFSTSFGQGVIERISKLAAVAGGADAVEAQRETVVSLSREQVERINAHIEAMRARTLGRPPHWVSDIAATYLMPSDAQERLEGRVISDLWWHKDGVDHYMSIKTVKPNIDQTAEAKRDLMRLKANDPSCRVYFGLYYNPFGESRTDYSWSPPKSVFNLQEDEVVLIGKNYWDTLGGDGFYEQLLQVAESCSEVTKKMISEMAAEQ